MYPVNIEEETKRLYNAVSSYLASEGFVQKKSEENSETCSYTFPETDIVVVAEFKYLEEFNEYSANLRVQSSVLKFQRKEISGKSIYSVTPQIKTWAKNAVRRIENLLNKTNKENQTFELDKKFLEKELKPLHDRFGFVIHGYHKIQDGRAQATLLYYGKAIHVTRLQRVKVSIAGEEYEVELGTALKLIQVIGESE